MEFGFGLYPILKFSQYFAGNFVIYWSKRYCNIFANIDVSSWFWENLERKSSPIKVVFT